MNTIFIINIILAAIGFYVAARVFTTKSEKKTLTCSIKDGHTCNDVVTSKFGKTFGIENTLLGMIYYAGIVISYIILLSFADFPFLFLTFSTWVFIASVGGALFSIYLVALMAWVLKEWCDWCLISAICSIGIGVLALVNSFVL